MFGGRRSTADGSGSTLRVVDRSPRGADGRMWVGDTARRARRAVLTGALATVVCSLPLYLTGALAVQLTEDLAFGLTQLGIAVAMFRAIGVVTSSFMGVLADRIGAKLSLRIAVGLAATSAIGVGGASSSWWTLMMWLAVGACGKSLCQPAANRLLINNVHSGRRGLAFGVKQSAAPASSMVGGLSVPIIALTVGWRWAYALVAVMGLITIILVGKRKGPPGTWRKPKTPVVKLRDRATIITLAVAFGLGTAASSTVPAFYVDAAVRAGTGIELAGTLLAGASVAAMIARVGSGLLADQLATGHVRLCAGLLITGALGLGLLATNSSGFMSIGVVIALSGTWGFNGVFWYALMRAYPESPGKVTGAVAPGGLTGGVVGPIVVGALAEQVSYSVGWGLAGASALLGAIGMVYGSRRLTRLATASV